MKSTSNPWWLQGLAAAAMVLGAWLFWNQGSQTSAWVYPYFSGAANLGLDLAWRIDANAYSAFVDLSYAEQMNHLFVRGAPGDLLPYSILDRGYVYIVWLAQTLLFWLPPIKAVLWLQVGFHVLSVLWVLSRLTSRRQQLVFLLAYGLNPVVLHFVTFAYYYYWQVLPALLWVAYEARGGAPLGPRIYAMAVAMMAIFLIRQSTLLVCLCMLAYWVWRERTLHAGLALLALLVFVLAVKNPSQPWHTAYVGLGAYPNAGGLILSDESGYSRYQQLTGVQINTALPDGNYYDARVRADYYQVLRQELTHYATQHPLELARNAVINLAQSFSLGYVVKSRTISYLSAAAGGLVMVLMAWQGMVLRMIVLAAGVVGFVLYFPPIPAYMFGNYLLLAWALVHVRGPWQRWLPRTSAARPTQHTQ
ncbi:hypothetical protein PSQ20_00405 [Curvibacter sp. RS43]|uniref:hypothetical protein n=1 Tax=Curvibacter microcysteis TaxID=3026419 RepID=UPI00236221FC|nr:hypothetical protein [Curvibacter sp. RS43]MDD0808785.1 hypothetical protein [Curvibacter sp. RS43]